MELGTGGRKDLLGGPFAGTYSGVDGAPMTSDVCMFSGEIESVIHGSGELENSIKGTSRNVAVRAEGIGVGLPVVSGTENKLRAQVVDGDREDASELLACQVADLLSGALIESR